jgi:glycosyltransferase involved in cell wall biosynthesis
MRTPSADVRRLLMISPHFPPDGSAGTHRVRLLAPHLAEYGWTPTVLTVAEQDYESRLDSELALLVPSSLHVVRSRALPVRMTRRLGIGDLGLRALPGLRRAAWRLLDEQRFDAAFITIYPTYPAALGPMIKRRFNVPFVLDYQDPWVGAWGRAVGGGADGAVDAKSRSTRSIAERLEPHVLCAADAVTAVSARTYEEALARTGAAPRATAEIPIGWDPGDIEALEGRPRRSQLIPADGRFHFCYTGTVLPMGTATVRALLSAVRTLVDRDPAMRDRVRFDFFGTSNQTVGGVPRVMPVARDLGIEALVMEHPARLDYLDALAVLRQADALLLLGSSERHYTPSKLFPALLANRPIVALYHTESTAVSMLNAAAPTACVITFDDARPVDVMTGCVVQALRSVLTAGSRAVVTDRRALEPWSAHVLAGRLATVCDRIVV